MTQKCPICNNDLGEGQPNCPHCGFKMLGSTQSFQPVKLAEDVPSVTSAGAQRYELRVVRGPQTGIAIPLKPGTLSVGRDPRCDVFLNDMTVSRDHALIEIGNKGCIIKDQNSFNGVWVNDRMVDTYVLKSGDLIQIGAFCLAYREHL